MGSIFEPLITSGKVDELADKPQIAGLKASLELPAKDYLKAMRLRRLMQAAISRIFGAVDVLLAPGPRRHRVQDRSAARPRRRRHTAQGSRLPRHHSDGQSRRTSRPGAALRLRREHARGAPAGGRRRSPKTPCSPSAANSSPTPTGTSAARLHDPHSNFVSEYPLENGSEGRSKEANHHGGRHSVDSQQSGSLPLRSESPGTPPIARVQMRPQPSDSNSHRA